MKTGAITLPALIHVVFSRTGGKCRKVLDPFITRYETFHENYAFGIAGCIAGGWCA